MEDFQNRSNSSENSKLVIPDPLQTPFAKPPTYGEISGGNLPTVKPRGSGKKILKRVVIILVIIVGIVGGYFALNNYFPQYAKYVEPYLGPVLDPIMEQLEPVMDKIGLAKPVDPSPSPQPSPQGSPSTSSGQSAIPADWKPYRNFEYGFEFKYPSNYVYTVKRDPNLISYFELILNVPNPELTESGSMFLEINDPGTGRGIECGKVQLTKETINNINMSREEDTDCGNIFYKFSSEKDEYSLMINGESFDEDIFNQILSTFKFPPDTDGDGLPDAEEPKYGTNPNSPDTDDDSWPDGEEVQNGYNPLGPGKAK